MTKKNKPIISTRSLIKYIIKENGHCTYGTYCQEFCPFCKKENDYNCDFVGLEVHDGAVAALHAAKKYLKVLGNIKLWKKLV